MQRLFAHRAKLIFLGVFALVVAANHAFLFVTPWHEDGDFAVNALQIERARHFNELYGNYSRFHFNHPGPGFFYVYAAGEFIFLDWLQVVPSPHNAHALTGLILQTAFFSLALAIAAGWVRSRWFIPLALLLAGIHFGLAGNAFTSIWPPHVLLMPFLCFLVAGASTAAGRAEHLPLTLLSGCFLMHGHVAQPLFVVLLSGLVAVWFLRTSHRPGESWRDLLRRHPAACWTSAVILAVFMLPLVVDAALGTDSNMANIISFMRSGDEKTKTVVQSLSYLLSFFGYFHDQDHYLPAQGAGQPGFIWEHAAWYSAWLAVIAFSGYTLWALRKADPTCPERRFLTALGAVIGGGLVLAVVWGIMQTGPMFEFNAHFYFALIYALLLVFAAGIALRLPERGALWVGLFLCFGGAVALWQGRRPPESTINAPYSWVAATDAVLAADPQPRATKFLVFEHDNWGDVVKTALALKRMGGSYRVDRNWSFMFGRYRSFHPAAPLFDLNGMSVWRFSRHALPGRSVTLAKDLKVYFDPCPLDPAAFTIDCSSGGNLEQFILFGFTSPDGAYSWTNLPEAGLQFRSGPVDHDVEMKITAEPFTPRGRIRHQAMDLLVNGEKVAAFDLDRLDTVSARIPAAVWNRRQDVTVVFLLPGADSPRRLNISPDPRLLGWAIYRIAFTAVRS